MEKYTLNPDLTISEGSDQIAAYDAGSETLRIVKGHGQKRGALIKLLGKHDCEVGSHKMVETLVVVNPEDADQAPKKQPNTRAQKTETDPDTAGAAGDEVLSRMEAEVKEREAEIARLRKRLEEQEKGLAEASKRPGRPIPLEDKDLSPKEKILKYGPERDLDAGDKTPRVMAWAREHLSPDEYVQVYGHRVTPE